MEVVVHELMRAVRSESVSVSRVSQAYRQVASPSEEACVVFGVAAGQVVEQDVVVDDVSAASGSASYAQARYKAASSAVSMISRKT